MIRVVDLLLLLVLSISLYTDLKQGKIYNEVTAAAVIAGIGLNYAVSGFHGLAAGLAGTGVGLAVFFIPFLLGGLGAGDVKLMGAIGALKGPVFVSCAGVASAVAGGGIALMIILSGRGLIGQAWDYARLYLPRWRPAGRFVGPIRTVKAFPYGAAIFAGTVFTLATGWNAWVF